MKTEGGIRKPFFDMTHVFLWKIGLIFLSRLIIKFLILKQQILGCMILRALLNEFAFHTRSCDIGLSWEFHIQCKKSFEV